MSMAISFTSCLKSRVLVRRSRRIVSLCWIRGWARTVRFANAGVLPMVGKVGIFFAPAKEPRYEAPRVRPPPDRPGRAAVGTDRRLHHRQVHRGYRRFGGHSGRAKP